jgi:hypothetical protein
MQTKFRKGKYIFGNKSLQERCRQEMGLQKTSWYLNTQGQEGVDQVVEHLSSK